MTWIVFGVGALIMAGSVTLLASPGLMRRILVGFPRTHWIVLAAVIRITLGVLLIAAAPGTRAPLFVQAVGVVTILAGLSVAILGRARLQTLVDWFLARPDRVFRGWSVVGLVFGAAVLWAGIPS